VRRYYLRKRPNPPGQWQKVFLDLRLDDDSAWQRPTGKAALLPSERQRVRLKFIVTLRDLTGQADPRLALRLAELRFVRYPVRLTGGMGDVVPLAEPGRVGQSYALTVRNQTDSPQRVHLEADTGGLNAFRIDLPSEPLELTPGESRQFRAAISTSPEQAKELPPLASESASLFAWCEAAPDLVTTWYEGYLVKRLTGAVPPAERPAP